MSQNGLCGDYTWYVKFTRIFRLLKNIVYRVHLTRFALYRVCIARCLQKNIVQGWFRPNVQNKIEWIKVVGRITKITPIIKIISCPKSIFCKYLHLKGIPLNECEILKKKKKNLSWQVTAPIFIISSGEKFQTKF